MFKKSLLALALGTTASLTAMSAHAVAVNTGDKLLMTAGVVTTASSVVTSVTGSYFGMDTNGNGKIANNEKTALSNGTTGLVIGVTTTAGASHSGAPTAGDTNAIDAPWNFFGNTGSDYTPTTPITGSTTAGLNFSNWTVTWNGIPAINMGGGAWGTGFSNGVANFVWDGVYGHAYTLDYTATVPVGDPSKFGGVKYALHLEGTVAAAPVPEASTYGMMLAGLGLVGFAARRRKQA